MRTPTGQTPFSLVYVTEAVLPAELEVKSLRVAMESRLSEADWIRQRYDQLNLINERRLEALDRLQVYQRRMARAYNKKVRNVDPPLKAGDFVLKLLKETHSDPRGKFRPNWEGPYVIKKVLQKGAVRLMDMDGNEFINPVNVDKLRRYYV